MRRYNYGQNFQAFNSSKMTWLTPLGFFEVAPGDTVSGALTPDAISDTLKRKVLNRAYYDTYVFYVPYRLLMDDWPDFIGDDEYAGAGVPSNATVTKFFFENGSSDGNTNCAFPRRAYNLIWNKFFRITTYQPEQDLDNAFALQCNQRESTFHESAWPTGVIDDTKVTINVANEEVSVDALREGFAKDKWQKTRDYYGTKYVDYLSALGIRVPWSIAEEPELIGKNTKDWVMRETTATVDGVAAGGGENNYVGNPAGYYEGKSRCRIKPTFCPEHGLIYAVGVARMDQPNRSGNKHPVFAKYGNGSFTREMFYSPEFNTQLVDNVRNDLFGIGNPRGS